LPPATAAPVRLRVLPRHLHLRSTWPPCQGRRRRGVSRYLPPLPTWPCRPTSRAVLPLPSCAQVIERRRTAEFPRHVRPREVRVLERHMQRLMPQDLPHEFQITRLSQKTGRRVVPQRVGSDLPGKAGAPGVDRRGVAGYLPPLYVASTANLARVSAATSTPAAPRPPLSGARAAGPRSQGYCNAGWC
jgi:hypothetical protein